MGVAFNVWGYNTTYGKFRIHTTDLYNLNNHIDSPELEINLNDSGSFKFKVFPSNPAFGKLLPIETDIIIEQLQDNVLTQIFTGILLNPKSYSNANLEVGKEMTCISSHILLNNLKVTLTDNMSVNITDATTFKQAHDLLLPEGWYLPVAERSIRHTFSVETVITGSYIAQYEKNTSAAKMIKDAINYYGKDVMCTFNWNTYRHDFRIVDKQADSIVTFRYGEMVNEYVDEIDYSTFANQVFLKYKHPTDENTSMWTEAGDEDSIKKYGLFTVVAESDIADGAVANAEANRLLTIYKTPQYAFDVKFIDKDNAVNIGSKIRVVNPVFNVDAEFYVMKINFNLDEGYYKKLGIKNTKINYIKDLGKLLRKIGG